MPDVEGVSRLMLAVEEVACGMFFSVNADVINLVKSDLGSSTESLPGCDVAGEDTIKVCDEAVTGVVTSEEIPELGTIFC